MKKIILLYLLVFSPGIFAQVGALNQPESNQHISYNSSAKPYENSLKNLVLIDQNSNRSNENKWMLNIENSSPPLNSTPFTSLLLVEQLKNLNQSTPFHVAHNATLERFIRIYLKDRRENLSQLLGKASYYFPVFEQYLDKYNLPLEIKYLAVVESALNPSAISSSGAKGLWQFMYGTGLEYDLYIDSYVDERYDYIKSTKAACAYLQKLFHTFNDWDLALAAYNSGPGNVKKAIKRAGGKTNYWEIRQFLPKETRSYVPAFYATLYIFSYADYHNIHPVKPDLFYFETDTVHIKQTLSFDAVNKNIGIEHSLLKNLNPQYKKAIIPVVKDRNMMLTLPKNLVSLFLEKETKLYGRSSPEKGKALYSKVIPINSYNSYLVREGDNLQSIAVEHSISLSQLKTWNGLYTDYLIAGQSLVITNKNQRDYLITDQSEHKINSKTYIVQEGDTLFKISRKFGNIPISQLRSWNNLNQINYLKPGRSIKIYPTNSQKSTSLPNKS